MAEGKNLTLVATDGHRLALAQATLETDIPKQEVILPRKTVLELQRLLKMLNVYTGPVDGMYGPMLRVAIEMHERRQHLPVTGLPTPSLLQQLGHQVPPVETGSIPQR